MDTHSDECEVPNEVPTTPKAHVASALPIRSTSNHHSAGQTSELAPLYVQPFRDEQRILNTAFDQLSAVVKSTAGKTGLPAESIIFQWIAQRTLTQNAAKEVKGAKLRVHDAPQSETTTAASTVSHKQVRQKASGANSIEKELRELICEKAAHNGLQWSTLLNILAENGYYLDNYPDITLPGSINAAKSAGRKKGIREVPVEEQRTLFVAMMATDYQCTFKAYKSRSSVDIKALQEGEAPIVIFAPPTGSSKSERGKRYFLNRTTDFKGHAKCLEHPGCKGNGSVVVTQGRQSSSTIAETQSTPSSNATTSNWWEERKISRMLHFRRELSSAGAREVLPAQEDTRADVQRKREETDTGKEQEGTTASVKRTRIDSPPQPSESQPPMPMSLPDEQLFPECDRFLQEGSSRYMDDPSHYSEIHVSGSSVLFFVFLNSIVNLTYRSCYLARRDLDFGDQQSHKYPLERYAFLLQWQGIALTDSGWATTAERDTFINCLTRIAHNISENEQYMKVQEIRMGVYKVICLSVKHHGQAMATQIIIMQNLQFYEHLSEPMAECLTFLAKEFDHAQLGDEILREIARKDFSSAGQGAKAAQDSKGPHSIARFLVRFAELSPRSILNQLSLLLNQLDSDVQKQISGLFDVLTDRMLDISTYVRAKFLSVFVKPCELKNKFPKKRLAITRAAVGALEDIAATVCKNAVALLIKLISTHPWGLIHGGTLTFETQYKAVKKQLEKVEGAIGKAVEQQQDDDDEEDEEENEGEECQTDDEETEEGSSRKKRKSGKKRQKEQQDDEMDVDDEDRNTASSEDDEGNKGDDAMDDDAKEWRRKLKAQEEEERRPRASQQAALAALESNQMLHLRLRKKYYAEALNFIRQIEAAMDTVAQLLGSTNKPEVLESMRFFQTAQVYDFENAQVGIKKMLHLIWHKDNNSTTSEDGKELKGIRFELLECYRNLYFEPPPDTEVDAKAQVNRIAKNMIELTYDATLAELTSLEEMMQILMDEGCIHHDVISKLWQVYTRYINLFTLPRINKPLPKAQRRGAIIVLGMLALAKRIVLTDHAVTAALVKTFCKLATRQDGSHGRPYISEASGSC
ncbi:hypothetical protein JOM56_014108 [Amanita muscaria]